MNVEYHLINHEIFKFTTESIEKVISMKEKSCHVFFLFFNSPSSSKFHPEKQPYKWNECGKFFSWPSSLQGHHRIHSGANITNVKEVEMSSQKSYLQTQHRIQTVNLTKVNNRANHLVRVQTLN